MSNTPSFSDVKANGQRCAIAAPRPEHMIAPTLASAFACRDGVPNDWFSLLASLDDVDEQIARR